MTHYISFFYQESADNLQNVVMTQIDEEYKDSIKQINDKIFAIKQCNTKYDVIDFLDSFNITTDEYIFTTERLARLAR